MERLLPFQFSRKFSLGQHSRLLCAFNPDPVVPFRERPLGLDHSRTRTGQAQQFSSSIPFMKFASSEDCSPSISSSAFDAKVKSLNPSLDELKQEELTPIPESSPSSLLKVYLDLSKPQLGALVVLSTMVGYTIAPCPLSLSTLLPTTVGTALCVASANMFNQWIEAPFDAQMKRTKTRPLVRGLISTPHAFAMGALCGTMGGLVLYSLVNPLTAVLGLSNIVLYSFIYTPMKRISTWNTTVGAVVGAVPALMGWAAGTGGLDLASMVLAYALFAWQFPHFNSLSWSIRPEYAKAGYQMMSLIDPLRNKKEALYYSLSLFAVSFLSPLLGLTTVEFIPCSGGVNLALVALSYRFYRNSSDRNAKNLFFFSLLHWPLLLILMMIFKKKPKTKETSAGPEEQPAISG